MFMNMAANATNAFHESHAEEGPEDTNASGANEPEVTIGGNVSFNFEQMPEDLTGAFRSMMEMLSGNAPHGQPQDQTNGRTGPN